MNLTVGPLSPAVYWRRRALVLGLVLLLVLLGVALCNSTRRPGGTGGRSNGAGGGTASSLNPTTSDSGLPTTVPSGGDGGGELPGPSDEPGGPGGIPGDGSGGGGSGGGLEPDAPACTDAQLSVTVAVQPLSSGYYLTLKIRNISTTTCNRDVGAGPQEMHVVNSANAVVWSSDFCQIASHAPDLRTFHPNIEAVFKVWWNGRAVQGPRCGRSSVLPPATYRAYAKLDTKLSPPVSFVVAGAK
jgi:hypothetical protein